MTNCCAVGNVDGIGESTVNTGGLVGVKYYSTQILSSFWNIETSNQTDGVGADCPEAEVWGKTTAEMMMEGTFTDAGWDFIEIWNIGENQTYPYLRQYPAGDLNHDNIVNLSDVAIISSHWLEGVE